MYPLKELMFQAGAKSWCKGPKAQIHLGSTRTSKKTGVVGYGVQACDLSTQKEEDTGK